ncbi:unnamed protein product [Bemisia tabaci]|uniref:Uncharacterized protein n=1 Tax=Bemisia tabaci TaxID=7038 RepID=A0A9P0AIT4_BEMTA|nr:unnamed protein product [Bemisia tabaci]
MSKEIDKPSVHGGYLHFNLPSYSYGAMIQLFELSGMREVTELADGIFMGFSMNHAVVDGVSLWHFINTLAEVTRGAPPSNLPDFTRDTPLATRAVLPLPPGGPAVASDSDAPLRERIFHFTSDAIARLKRRANEGCPSDAKNRREISSFVSLCAQLWRSVTRARQETTLFRMAVNCRQRQSAHPPSLNNCIKTLTVPRDYRETLKLRNRPEEQNTDLSLLQELHQYYVRRSLFNMINEDAWDSYTFKYMSGHFESYIDRSSFKRESCVSNSQREQPDNQQKTGPYEPRPVGTVTGKHPRSFIPAIRTWDKSHENVPWRQRLGKMVGIRQKIQPMDRHAVVPLNPKLDPHYFGNAVQSTTISASAEDLLTEDLGWGARLLRDTVATHDDSAVRRQVAEWTAHPRLFWTAPRGRRSPWELPALPHVRGRLRVGAPSGGEERAQHEVRRQDVRLPGQGGRRQRRPGGHPGARGHGTPRGGSGVHAVRVGAGDGIGDTPRGIN